MNKSLKGQKKETLARKMYEKEGWTCVFQSRRSRAGGNDFADLFDLVLVKSEIFKDPEGQTINVAWKLYVSCKSYGKGNNHLGHQKEIVAWKEKYGYPLEFFELALWKSPRWEGRGNNKKYSFGEWKKVRL